MTAYGCSPKRTRRRRSLARKPGVVRSMRSSSKRWRRSRSNSSSGNEALRARSAISSRMPSENSARPDSGNGARIGAGVRAEARAHAAQILFDLAAGARGGAGADDGGGHVGQAGRAMRDDGVAAAEIELRGDFRECARFGEDDLQAVGERADGALGPGDRAFGRERRCGGAMRNGCGGRTSSRTSMPTADSKARADLPAGVSTMARFCGTRYFFATA